MSTSSSLSIKDGVRATSSLTGAPAAARPIAAIWPLGQGTTTPGHASAVTVHSRPELSGVADDQGNNRGGVACRTSEVGSLRLAVVTAGHPKELACGSRITTAVSDDRSAA
jgi:hypothetical protein